MTVHVLTVPFAGKWLTANDSTHRYGRGRDVKEWRVATVLACQAARLPRGLTVQVAIHAVCYYVGRRPVLDSPNLYPTIKAIIDGMTPARDWVRKGKPQRTPGYGLLTNDTDKQIPTLPTWELHGTFLQPRVELTITEVTS